MAKAHMPTQIDFEKSNGKQIDVVFLSRFHDMLLVGYVDGCFSLLTIGDTEPSKLAKAFNTNIPWVGIYSMEFKEADLCYIFPKEIVGPWFGRVYTPKVEKSSEVIAAVSSIVSELTAKKELSLAEADLDESVASAHEAAANSFQEAIDVVTDRMKQFLQVACDH